LPLSATLVTERVYKAFLGRYEDFKAFYHGHTYSANPLACAAALANLDLFEKRKTLPALEPRIRLLSKELWKIQRLAHVGDIRQVGLMAGIELVQSKATKKPYPLAEKKGVQVIQWARKHGVMIRPLGNVIVLMPPLSITAKELVKLCRVIRESIQKVTEKS
jgi:adenosylmethionine-8-amino-7-oxononanoate aminotransferase